MNPTDQWLKGTFCPDDGSGQETGQAVDTIAYSYTDSNWKDKLTAYDGQTITYDAIGNPLNDGTWTYTWEKGRQLKQMSKSGMTVEFKYDHNGLRTQKKVTSGGEVTVTDYTLHGKLVTHLTRGSDEMHFFYDAQSRPAMVKFNGALYSYVHNLQGDIVGILDNAGSLVVEYKYDAWGKPTLVRTLTTAYEALAELNPFRYRGYVYDEEISLYYLQRRFYNHRIGRFINEDVITGDALLGKNAYCYCTNSPVNFFDFSGKIAITAFFAVKLSGAIIGGIAGFVGSVVSDLISNNGDIRKIDWGQAAEETAKGALSGSLTNPIASTGLSIILDTYEYIVDAKASGEEVDEKMIAWHGITNIAGGVLDNGIDIALGATRTLIDDGVETLAQSVTNTMTNAASHEAENRIKGTDQAASGRTNRHQSNTPKGVPQSTDPYLITIWDASIGKYREVAVYPGKYCYIA